jgi:hypothetical protein
LRLSESAKIAAPAAPDPTELEVAGIVFTPLLQLWLQLRGRPPQWVGAAPADVVNLSKKIRSVSKPFMNRTG